MRVGSPVVVIRAEPRGTGSSRDVVSEGCVGQGGGVLLWEQGRHGEHGQGGGWGERAEGGRNLVTKLLIEELLNGGHCVSLVMAEDLTQYYLQYQTLSISDFSPDSTHLVFLRKQLQENVDLPLVSVVCLTDGPRGGQLLLVPVPLLVLVVLPDVASGARHVRTVLQQVRHNVE